MRPSLRTLPLLVLVLASLACHPKFGGKDGGGDDTDGGVVEDAGGGGDAGDGENRPPIAVDDSAQARTEQTVEIDVTGNDSDPDDDSLLVTEVVQPKNGLAAIVSRSLVEYTSDAGFVGTDTFEYTVDDQNGGSDTATVTVNVVEGTCDSVGDCTLIITEPTKDEVIVGEDVRISFEITGCNVARPSSDAEGCHVHNYLDGAVCEDVPCGGFGHYSGASYTISPIELGEHDFTLVLISNDGTDDPFPVRVEDTVTFTVTEPGAADAGPDGG